MARQAQFRHFLCSNPGMRAGGSDYADEQAPKPATQASRMATRGQSQPTPANPSQSRQLLRSPLRRVWLLLNLNHKLDPGRFRSWKYPVREADCAGNGPDSTSKRFQSRSVVYASFTRNTRTSHSLCSLLLTTPHPNLHDIIALPPQPPQLGMGSCPQLPGQTLTLPPLSPSTKTVLTVSNPK